MARRGSAIAGNRAVGTAPSTGGALAPATPASPLAQSLATGMGVNTTGRVNRTGGWGDAYGGLALPRNPQDFTDGAFGPFAPIIPSPVDAPPQGGDFPLARREEYRVGWNLPTGQPGAEGLKLADFGTLRTLADLYSVARACITYLKSEIASLEWDVSPTTEAAKAMRNDKAAMTDFGERRGEAVKFFRRPDPDYFSWQSWMSAVMEEVLVFDALSIVLRPKWGRGLKKGLLWSDLDSLNLISGPTVRPLYDMNGATPRPPAPAYQQYLYGVPRVDMMTMIRQRDLDEGRLRESALGAYTNSQLLYLPMQPRRWTPYGFPPIERALIPVLTGLSKQGYQLDYFKEGTVPSVYISPGGDLSPNQIRELQDALNAVAGDPAWHHKIIVLPSGSHTEPQRPTPLADMFDDIVMTQVCSAFGVQPSQIGITPRATAAAFTSPAAANSAAKQNSNTQDMSTLQPTLLFLTAIMNSLLQDVCGQEDMRFVFAGMQEEEDEETTTNLLVNQVSHALITIDEARDKLGLQPYGITESTEPGFLTPTGFMFLSQPAAPELPPQMGGNDGESGGGNQPPAAPGGKPAPPPQYGPKPNGPANSTQGRPAQPPAKEPGEKSPANAAAEGTNNAKNKPDQGGVNKAAEPDDTAQQPDPDAPDDTFDQAAQLALEAYIAKQVAGIVTSAWGGSITLLEAVGWIIQELGAVYMKVMTAASKSAAAAVEGVAAMATGDLFALAQQRAEQQRPYSMGMVQAAVNDAAMGGTEPPAWIQGRAKLYAETLAGSYNCGYGETVKTSEPDYTLIWRLGETEHCPLCLERDGNEYTFESLPGYPGDGGFGGPICKGGPNCGCHLEYRKGDRVDTMGNPHRGQMEYYAQQKKDIMARRQQMQAEREQFVAGLPNQTGTDGTSAQSRAVSRDQMRQQLADLANQRIRSNGGYPGVSVEPSDIPASLIASLIPQYGPIPATVPLTDIMNAVESMFAGKFASADTTKTAFGSLMISAVVDTVSGWERAVASEMEACARHLDKGRAAGTWEPRRIDQRDVDTLADLLQTGAISRAQAVKQALDNRRRWVDVGGQVMVPPTAGTLDEAADEEPPYQGAGGPVANAMRDNPAGGGGYVLLPHDAHGIHHDRHDLGSANKIGPKGYVHGWIREGVAPKDRIIPAEHINIPRSKMPQLVGAAGKGTPAEAIAGGEGKFADLRGHFEAALQKDGIGVTHERVPSGSLKAAQNELSGTKVGGLATAVESGDPDALRSMDKPIYVSRDNYVIDGHHKWAAAMMQNGGSGTHELNITRVDLPIRDALDYANSFASRMGIAPRDVTVMNGPGVSKIDAIAEDYFADDLLSKAAADPGDPNPVEAEHVYNQMLANYPPKSIQWIKQARWIGPMAVDPERVDTQDEDSWAASHEPDRIKHFIKDIKKGKDIKPGVCVQEPGQDTVKVIDGHHRFLAARESGEPYKAYVGFVNSDSGPWDETHSFQFHQGADPQNKTVEIDLRGSQVMNDADLDRFIQMFGERLAKSAVPGLTKRSGMVSIDLPDGLIEPVPGGPTDHHITLAYLGPDVDDGTLNDVLRVAKSVAANSKPFTVTAGGVDAFPPSDGSDGKVPAYVPVDATDKLKTLREPFAQYHASEHQGFTPHVTLAYLNESEALPEPVPQVTIPVDAVHVHRGDQVYQIPFGYDGTSPITVKSAETPALSTVHKPLGTHGLWHDKDAQLPAYIQNIAHAMIRDGHDESGAIQLAVGAVQRWARGEGNVTPEVQAAAAGALADWERLKAEHNKTKSGAADVAKVGAKGYVHGWIRVGAGGVRAKDVGVKYHADDHAFDVDHARTGVTLATGKVKRDGSYTVTHKDGTKLGTFHSLGEVQDAVARHHNEKYSTFDRDTEPELAGYHDAVSGHERTFEERDRSGDEDAYSRGHAQGTADLENNRLDYLPGVKTVDPELVKVGPHGYIHGWIYVGAGASGHLSDITEQEKSRGNAALANFSPKRFGSAAEAHSYLKENAPKLSSRQRGALDSYTGDSFYALNKRLRSGNADDPMVKDLDSAFSPSEHDLILTRHVNADAFGLKDSELSKVEDLKGKKIVDSAYQSSSLGTSYGGGIGGVTMHIMAPKGTPVINASAYSRNPTENEVLLGRGQQLAVAKVVKNDEYGYDVYVIALPKET